MKTTPRPGAHDGLYITDRAATAADDYIIIDEVEYPLEDVPEYRGTARFRAAGRLWDIDPEAAPCNRWPGQDGWYPIRLA